MSALQRQLKLFLRSSVLVLVASSFEVATNKLPLASPSLDPVFVVVRLGALWKYGGAS